MRTKELPPLETTPFWKLLLMVLRSTMRRIKFPDTELIPLPRLFASVLSRTVMVTPPEMLFAFTPSELAAILLLLMTTTAPPPHGRLRHDSTARRGGDAIGGNVAVVHLEQGVVSVRGK